MHALCRMRTLIITGKPSNAALLVVKRSRGDCVRAGGARQRVKIRPTFQPPACQSPEVGVEKKHGGYKSAGTASLDWVQSDPSRNLRV